MTSRRELLSKSSTRISGNFPVTEENFREVKFFSVAEWGAIADSGEWGFNWVFLGVRGEFRKTGVLDKEFEYTCSACRIDKWN